MAINNAGQIVGVAADSSARGHTGTRTANLAVTLSAASSQPVTVSYGTANGSAAAASDYQAASGTVTFDAGQTNKTISVLVNGDRAGDDRGRRATDQYNDVSKNEGNSGTTPFVFTVSLSPAFREVR